MLTTIVLSVFIFGFLIVIHELGHFIAARISKVQVLEFAIGMGPVIYTREGRRTKFSLRALPIGGFCKMKGEDEDDFSEDSFNAKGKGARIFILASGALMNIIGAIVLLSLVFFLIGTPTTTLEQVETDYPAYAAGLRSGDRIVSIDEQNVTSWDNIIDTVSDENQGTYLVAYERGGETLTAEVTSLFDEEAKRFRIGITPARERGLFRSMGEGVRQTVMYTGLMFQAIGQLITGKASTDDLMGPIGIVTVVGETAQFGAVALFNLAAVISLNLAIFNLLPIPALDGSRIVFILVEWIKGSPVNPEKEGMIHLIGFALLMVLAIFIAYNDILRLN